MTKSEIVQAIASRQKIPVAKVETVVNELLEIVALALAMDEPVKFVNFGHFFPRHRKAMILRDPRDGKPVDVAPRTSVGFHPASALRARVDPLYVRRDGKHGRKQADPSGEQSQP